MKVDTHPTYFPESKITCACGNVFTIGSTKKEMSVEICSNCHPFYTGNDKTIDAAGRVERFKARATKATPKKEIKAKKTTQSEEK